MPVLTHSTRRFFNCHIFLAFAAIILWPGCSSSDDAAVTGAVTLDGKPVETGAITFMPTDGKSRVTGTQIKAGKYSAKVPLGVQRVEIHAPKVVGHKKMYNAPDSPLEEITDEALPPKYHSQSELQLEVKAGENQKDFSLTSK